MHTVSTREQHLKYLPSFGNIVPFYSFHSHTKNLCVPTLWSLTTASWPIDIDGERFLKEERLGSPSEISGENTVTGQSLVEGVAFVLQKFYWYKNVVLGAIQGITKRTPLAQQIRDSSTLILCIGY